MASWIRFPAVHGGRVAFVADDDVFEVPVGGGVARRLTSGAGVPARPAWSPDGERLTWDSTAEGPREVWSSASGGGPAERLTWGGATNLGFDPEGRVLVRTSDDQPFAAAGGAAILCGGVPERVPFGPLAGLAHAPSGRVLLVRHATDLSAWRGYRGGRLGVAWLGTPRGPTPDWRSGAFAWERVELPHAVACPVWWAGRFWFVGDPGEAPELCSVDESGHDPRVHTGLGGFGVRTPAAGGDVLVFVHDGELYRWTDAGPRPIPVQLAAQRADRQRRPWTAARSVEGVDLHPDGHSLALVARGRAFSLGLWEGPARRWGGGDGARTLLARWVDRERLLVVTDAGAGPDPVGEYHLRLLGPDGARALPGPHGRPVALEVDPTGRRAALVDHAHHLFVVDLEAGGCRAIDHAPPGLLGLDWSADGAWLAWSRPTTAGRSEIRLLHAESGAVSAVTDGTWADTSPSFDPDGHLLYFLSLRDFDPVRDTVSFGYGFAGGVRPYCVTLRRDVPHPFRPGPRPLKAPPGARREDRGPIAVEPDGLGARVVPFPVAEGRFSAVIGLPGGHALLVREPVRGSLDRDWAEEWPRTDGTLLLWEADRQELTEVAQRVGDVRADRRREQVIWRSGARWRVALAKPDKAARDELKKTDGRAERKTGWLDPGRARDEIDPEREWVQMVHEAHRLMRDHFWRPPDDALLGRATAARDRALSLLPRVATRSELSDLLVCMLGTWGTSHAYEIGGDAPRVPTRKLGRLGAELSWSDACGGWRIDRILVGDPGTERCSPLLLPGACAEVGDVVVAVDGQAVGRDRPLAAALLDRAQLPVSLELVRPEDGPTRTVTATPLASDRELRYRDWVHGRRGRVRELSDGAVGYLHVPNMGPVGFAEFHRDWALASRHDAVLVDVRWNGGGHVSQILLRTLTQRRLGRKDPRHGPSTEYPRDAPPALLALLTNEAAGSDGDIFAHAWKRLGLGPVFGTRTWGGVVGITPRLRLVDRTLTTQPEWASWFDDVGYAIENRGVDPDVEIDVAPDVVGRGEDPALDTAVAHLRGRLS